MKKSILLFLFSFLVTVAGAQTDTLEYIAIGSAGNLYTIINSQSNMLDANDDLNTVVFIHRAGNPDDSDHDFPGETTAQYRFDVSKDGGQTWTTDIGPLNTYSNNTSGANRHARFPQVALYNPIGNINPDSAYLTYLGATHDGGTSAGVWDGIVYGRAQLSGNPTTFTEEVKVTNGGDVNVPGGFTKGLQNEYWAVDIGVDGSGAFTGEILLYKGMVNPVTDSFSVSLNTTLTPQLDASSGPPSITSLNMAFGPSGMNGWIVFLGDLTSGVPNTLNPVLYNTTDGGITWTGPTEVDLDGLTALQQEFGMPTNDSLTTGFDADITVDINGNPHVAVVVGTGENYSILSGRQLVMADITFSEVSNSWEAVVLDEVNTFRGTFGSLTEDNRPQASRTMDGSKVFFYWLDSPAGTTCPEAQQTNCVPNFKGAAIDINAQLKTPSINFTLGDPRWDGLALFASVSPTSITPTEDTIFHTPTVFVEIPQTDLEPVYFYYIQDISFTSSQFSQCLNNMIFLNGESVECVALNGTYNDQGATAINCGGGDATANIVKTGSVNTSVEGDYVLTYAIKDTADITDTTYRTVRVVAIPKPDFTYQEVSNPPLTVAFTNATIGEVDNSSWTFGDDNSSSSLNPNHTYSFPGDYEVCLTSSNDCAGSQDTCKMITVKTVGIEEALPESAVKIHPNPSTGVINVELAGGAKDVTVEVYNLIGELVEVTSAETITSKESIQLNLTNKSNGVYFIKVTIEEGVITKRVVISNK